MPSPLRIASLTCLACALCAAERTGFKIADFEASVDGFASGTHITGSAKSGKGCLQLKNDGNDPDQKWVSAGASIKDAPANVSGIRFWIRTSTATSIGVQLVDGLPQTFMYRLPITANGVWQQVEIRELGKPPASENWGKGADGTWHPTLTRLTFVLEGPPAAGGDKSVLIDNVEAILSAKKP